MSILTALSGVGIHLPIPAATVALAAETAPTGVGPVRAGVVTALLVVGTFFLLVGTIGVLRLPNVYNRMHATSKATTLGAASILLGGTVYFGPAAEGLTSLVGIVFLFLTAPTGTHMISRSARRMGVSFETGVRWPSTDDTPLFTDADADADEDDRDVASDGGHDRTRERDHASDEASRHERDES